MVLNISSTRSLAIFLGGKTSGSISKIMSLLEKTGKLSIPRTEWKKKLSASEMSQVKELLDLIEAHKLTGMTGASVLYSFFQRRVKRCTFRFEYLGTQDSSQMSADELSSEGALMRVKRVLLDVDAVPFVPTLFFLPTIPHCQTTPLCTGALLLF